MIYLVGGLCVFNIVMWIVFMVRFNKRFSSEQYINKARDDMNVLVSSMQKNTVRNIQLVKETIEDLEKARVAAERKAEQISKRIELLNQEIDMKNFHQTVQQKVKGVGVDPNAVYSINQTQNKILEKPAEQKAKPLEIKDEIHVTSTGASYKEVPVITGNFYDEKDGSRQVVKVQPKKNIDEQVIYLKQNGLSVSDIASRLNISETEVQFIIDLN